MKRSEVGDCALQFRDGTVLRVSAMDTKDPPPISCAGPMSQILDLNARWDDDPLHWRGVLHLVIHDRHIPMFYWRDLYSRRFPPVWNKIKSSWRSCKVRWDTQSPAELIPKHFP